MVAEAEQRVPWLRAKKLDAGSTHRWILLAALTVRKSESGKVHI